MDEVAGVRESWDRSDRSTGKWAEHDVGAVVIGIRRSKQVAYLVVPNFAWHW